MSNKLIIPEQLEKLLLKNWADFFNKNKLILKVLEDTRNSSFQVKKQKPLNNQLSISITKFYPFDNCSFEIWIEFCVPIEAGVAIGTHTYSSDLFGVLELKQSYGMIFNEN